MKKLLLSSFAFFREYVRRKKFFGVNLLFFLLLPIGCFKAKVISPAPVVYEINDYRTVGGTGQVWSNALIWQKFNGTSWNAAGVDGVPGATATVYINGAVDTGGSRTADKIIVEANAVLTVSSTTTSTTLTWVKSGGSLILNAAFTNNGVFEIENNGSLLINYGSASGIAPIWYGTEKFSAGSTVTIQNWNYSAGSGANRLIQNPSQISPNADGFLFGNLITSGALTGGFYLIQGNQEVNFCKNNYTMKNTAKNVIFTDGAAIIHIGGSMTVDGTQLSLSATASGGPVINVAGDLSVLSGSLNLNQTTSNSAQASLNLKGNLFVAQGANLSSMAHNSKFNFTGTGDGLGSFQTVDVFDNANAGSSYIDFMINSGAYVKPVNRNWGLGTNSSLIVSGGATLDFGFNDAVALNVVRSSTATGGAANGQAFEARDGSTLKISSSEGIVSASAYNGNVRIGAKTANRIFSPAAHYFYIGKTNAAQITASGVDQVSGTGFPANLLSGKIVIDLDTKTSAADDVGFRAEGIHKLTSTGTLTILKGKVVDNAGNGFADETNESGNFTMAGGRYQIFRSDTQPPLGNAYNISGGVIEFAGSAAIVIRDKPYLNVEVSGTNVSIGTSKKGLELQPNGKFTVKKDAVLKIANEEGFSGGAATAINSTNNPTIVLEDQSTIEYNRDGAQIITPFEPLTSDESNAATGGYFNLKISGKNGNLQTGTSKKLASGNAVYVRNNVEVALNARLIIDANQTLTVRKEVINNGGSATNFIVENDGNLVQINESAVNSGNITVYRNSPMQKDNYTYWSSPVAGQQFGLFSPGTSSSRFYQYDENLNQFVTVTPLTSTFVAGKGYAIMAPSSYSPTSTMVFPGTFTGVPTNGNLNFILQKGVASTSKGFNMIGNPYPSNIDFEKLYAKNTGAIYNTAYFWTNVDPNRPSSVGGNQNYSGNGYAIYNGTGGVAATGPAGAPGGGVAPTKNIKVGQGFIVKAKADANGKTLTFDNTMRNSDVSHFFSKQVNAAKDRFWLKLSTPARNVNTILIGYIENATNGFEYDYDSSLMVVGSDSFYSILDNAKLGIQGRSYPLVQSDVVPLGTKHFEKGNYTIGVGDREGIFKDNQAIYLMDLQTNITTNLSEGDYVFTSEAGEFSKRFQIVYEARSTLGVDSNVKSGIEVYRDSQDFVVRSSVKKIVSYEVIDMLGRIILLSKTTMKEIRFNADALLSGIYIIKVELGDGSTLTTKVKK